MLLTAVSGRVLHCMQQTTDDLVNWIGQACSKSLEIWLTAEPVEIYTPKYGSVPRLAVL